MTDTKTTVQYDIAKGWVDYNGSLPSTIEELIEFAEFFQECNTSPRTLSKQLLDTMDAYREESAKYEHTRPDYTPLGMTIGYYMAAIKILGLVRYNEILTLEGHISRGKHKDLSGMKESLELLKITAVTCINQAIFQLFVAARELSTEDIEFTTFRDVLTFIEKRFPKTKTDTP